MGFLGKLIGGAIGFALGGPAGLAVGVGLGHIADSDLDDNSQTIQKVNNESTSKPQYKVNMKVAGVTFDQRQKTIARLSENDILLLEREPNNPFDPNAVAVKTIVYEKIGYIPKEKAKLLAPVIDNGEKIYVRIVQIIGGGSYPLGVIISLASHSDIWNTSDIKVPSLFDVEITSIQQDVLANISFTQEFYLHKNSGSKENNRVGLFSNDNKHLCWLPEDLSREITPLMDKGYYYKPIFQKKLRDESGKIIGFKLHITKEDYDYTTKLVIDNIPQNVIRDLRIYERVDIRKESNNCLNIHRIYADKSKIGSITGLCVNSICYKIGHYHIETQIIDYDVFNNLVYPIVGIRAKKIASLSYDNDDYDDLYWESSINYEDEYDYN